MPNKQALTVVRANRNRILQSWRYRALTILMLNAVVFFPLMAGLKRGALCVPKEHN
jgi:hypothetical protein